MIPRELLRKIRRVEVRTRGLVEDVFGGEYHSAFRGRGIAFAEVRPYQIGDDVRTIDWNVSARMGEPFVKVFEEEREQTLLLAVDVSGSADFGTTGRTKRDLAAEIAAVLAFSAVRNGDHVGLLLFSDTVERFIPPLKGRRHALRLVRDLYVHPVAGRRTRVASALEHIRHVIRRRAIVVLVSDFLDPELAAPGGPFEKALRAASSRHDVVAVRLVDPREEALPDAGLLEVRDAETGSPVLVDTGSRRVRAAFAAKAQARGTALAATLRAARVDGVTVRTDEEWDRPLAAFFRRRTRRRR